MTNKLPTTVIGSFPKPDYLPIRDWFDSARQNGTMGSTDVTLGYTGWKASDADEALFRRATEEVIGLQVDAGVDVPTDGEVRRENYIHYHCRIISIIIAAISRDSISGILNAACCAMALMRRNFRQSDGKSRMTVRPTARTILQPARRSARER